MKNNGNNKSAGEAPEEETFELKRRATLHGELFMKRADFNRYADFSGCVWAAEELRDRFSLNKMQAQELALCIFWNSRSRAVFLIKCQVLLQDDDEADKFAQVAQKDKDENKEGAVGSYIMNMVDSKKMSRMASQLIRAQAAFIVWPKGTEGAFTPEFVAKQSRALHGFLHSAENLKKEKATSTFLNEHLKTLQHIGKFILPQVLPICYLMGLVECNPLRATEAPILDEEKKHYKIFVKDLGVDPKHFDLTLLIVALQYGTVPLNVECTGCESLPNRANVYDFMLPGQMFYNVRPEPGSNYKHLQFAVYVKKWGPGAVWVKATKDKRGRWRYPDS